MAMTSASTAAATATTRHAQPPGSEALAGYRTALAMLECMATQGAWPQADVLRVRQALAHKYGVSNNSIFR